MRKFLFLFSLGLAMSVIPALAETFSLTDGGSVAGEIVKADDNGVMIRTPEETYTNMAWGRFSQAALKQLAPHPKIKGKGYVEPFFEPDAAQRPPKAEITVNEVKRMERPANPSLLGGLFGSSLGLFLLFVVYAANLLAAYEISIVKARSVAQVMGVAALLPIIGPVIFLVLKMNTGPTAEEKAAEEIAAEVVAAQKPQVPIEIAEASWKHAESKQAEPQIFTRGKFTFNKRFVETKFADFLGAAHGAQAKSFSLSVKTSKEELAVERITSVAVAEVVFEVTSRGPVTVQLTDILEVKLTPKAA